MLCIMRAIMRAREITQESLLPRDAFKVAFYLFAIATSIYSLRYAPEENTLSFWVRKFPDVNRLISAAVFIIANMILILTEKIEEETNNEPYTRRLIGQQML
jgi:hypothetical protein